MKDRLFQFFGLTTAASLLAGCAFPDRTITPSLAQTEGAGGSKPTGTCEISPEALTSVMEMQKVLQEALKAPALEVLGIGEEQSAEVLKAPENQETSVMMIDADINGQTAEGGEALVKVVGEGTTRSCTAFSRINWGADAGRFHPDSGNPADFLLQEVRIDEKGQVGVVYGGGAELLISETDGKIEETTAILEGKVIKVENESKPGLLARVFQAIKIAKATFEGPKVALGEAEASETPTSPAVPTAVVPIETQAEPTVASTDEPTAEPTATDVEPTATSAELTQLEPMGKYSEEQLATYFENKGIDNMNAVLDKALADKVVKPVSSILPSEYDSHINEKGKIVSYNHYKGTWMKVVITEQAVVVSGGKLVDGVMKALSDLSKKLNFSMPSLSEELLVAHASFEWESGLRQHLQLVCGPRYTEKCNPSTLKRFKVGDVVEVYIPTEAFYVTESGMVSIDKIPSGQRPSASNTDRAIDFGAGLIALQNNTQLTAIKGGEVSADTLTPLYFREVK